MNHCSRLAVVLIALLVGGCAGSGTLLDLEDPDSLAGTCCATVPHGRF